MAYKWRWPVTAATALLTVAVCSSASQVGAANHEFFATHLERWFRERTDKALRRGAFHSVPDLIASIQEYIDSHNDAPRPYIDSDRPIDPRQSRPGTHRPRKSLRS
jgi:hypothetical protein